MRFFVLVALACLSACSWLGSRRTPSPAPTELVITGAPQGAVVFVDGMQAGAATVANDHPQVLKAAAGAHKVEIRLGDTVVYREDTYVGVGEQRIVSVLSGLGR